MTAMKFSDPPNGTVVVQADGSFTYTPNTGFVGTDVFSYTANNGTQTSQTGAVSITVQDASACGIGGSNVAPVRPILELDSGPVRKMPNGTT